MVKMVGVHQHLPVNQDRCMAYLLHIYEQYRTVVTIRFKFNILKLAAGGRAICGRTFGLFPFREDECANSRWPFLLKTAIIPSQANPRSPPSPICTVVVLLINSAHSLPFLHPFFMHIFPNFFTGSHLFFITSFALKIRHLHVLRYLDGLDTPDIPRALVLPTTSPSTQHDECNNAQLPIATIVVLHSGMEQRLRQGETILPPSECTL